MSPLGALALAIVAFLAAVTLTPPAGTTAAEGLIGYRRLALYLVAATLLVSTSRIVLAERSNVGLETRDLDIPAPGGASRGATWRHVFSDERFLLPTGLVFSLELAGWNFLRLKESLADPLGVPLWFGSMLILSMIVALPTVRKFGWPRRWPFQATPEGDSTPLSRSHYLPWILLACLLLVAAALRFPSLGDTPIGLNADEGDRGALSLVVLDGTGPESWFDTGWYYINMVYFRLLAGSMLVFGTSVAGARTLSAIVGLSFVGIAAWTGCRHFGWRVGLLVTALVTAGALELQHSRFISEAGITAFLWAVSIAGFMIGAQVGRRWAFILAGLAGGLGLYFYPSSRLWAMGAIATVVALWLQAGRGRRLGIAEGAVIAAIAAAVASSPFVANLSYNPAELWLRYDQTAVLNPQNQERLVYLSPGMPTSEVLLLQVERALGMFDRYPDGVSFLPTSQPALPRPLGGLTVVGAFYALLRAPRDPRFAVLSIWFWVGMVGVISTVETPDFLRASGSLLTFPFFSAIVIVETSQRLADEVSRLRRGSRRFWPLFARGLSPSHWYWSGDAWIGAVAVVAIVTNAYLYFGIYRTAMVPSWDVATQEGLQVARLGSVGPVYTLEMYEHFINSGWIRMLAQDALRGRIANPGAELPILASQPTDLDQRPRPSDYRLPVPRIRTGASFIVYSNANQLPYIGLLQLLYPGGALVEMAPERQVFQVPAAALDRTRGVTMVSTSTSPLVTVQTFGQIPPGTLLPASLEWRAGIRLAESGRYRFRLRSSSPARLLIDGIDVAQSSSDPAATAEISAAAGVHFVQVKASVTSGTDRIILERSTKLLQGEDTPTYGEFLPEEAFAPMDAPWGLLGQVSPGVGPTTSSADPVTTKFLDSVVAAAFLGNYVPLPSMPTTVVWSGTFLAPRSGTYRMVFAADGQIAIEIDGRPVSIEQMSPDAFAATDLGTAIKLEDGSHSVRITLTLDHSPRTVVRWNWVPPGAGGELDSTGDWSVVPPMVLRPDAPIVLER